ncbi:MAG: hemerythrin domain-containing protein [SAR324 cluster bacterium]|nr:hemerythrin domain-containing protein [SAR324 cluster bacterium]
MTLNSQSITEVMSHEHSVCDQLFEDAEIALADGRNEAGAKLVRSFAAHLNHHFEMEEIILFPAFEAVTGMAGGPTAVMRAEHQQIRGLLDQLSQELDAENFEEVIAIGETLNILIQQHNMKEENMLYPMSDTQLAENRNDILGKLKSFEGRQHGA